MPLTIRITDKEVAAAGGKTTAESRAKLRETLPKQEETAREILATVNDVVNHPGFETNVGLKGVGGYLQLPGTEARNWQSKYKQLTGETFLSAFNSLRGGGSITDVEGAKATQAMAALNDPGISEKEFMRNAKILEDTIKMGVNRQREKAGLGPKYDVTPEAATPQDKARAELERRKKAQGQQ